MQRLIYLFYKIIEQGWNKVYLFISSVLTKIKLYCNNIQCGKNLRSSGLPIIHISRKAKCLFGSNLTMGNWIRNAKSGLYARCKIEVRNGAELKIGNNVGMTATTIICYNKISIGNNVLLGVGVHIYDTDFHNINPLARLYGDSNDTVISRPVIIGDNSFIGAFSIILKGVTIGKNAVIGAGSVVTKDVPNNEIWAGNPAKMIRKQQS